MEAQIIGAGRDTFALNFFAIDYLENKKQYVQGGELNIALAGLAYVIDTSDPMPDNFSNEFCTYMPNTEREDGADHDFIGHVLAINHVKIADETLTLFDVRLINDDKQPNMFNLPILANPCQSLPILKIYA